MGLEDGVDVCGGQALRGRVLAKARHNVTSFRTRTLLVVVVKEQGTAMAPRRIVV